MKSLPGYFEHIADKTYIDKYPPTIINLDELKEGFLLECGSGTGNDLLWLLQHGAKLSNLWSIEYDDEAHEELASKIIGQLESMAQEGITFDTLFDPQNEGAAANFRSYTAQQAAGLWLLCNRAIDIKYADFKWFGIFDYVYANNTFHCAGSIKSVNEMLSIAYGQLKNSGVLFGRTLSDSIDSERLAAIENSQDVNHRFALETARAVQDGRLVGLPPNELDNMARSVGFSETYTEPRIHAWKPAMDFYFRFVK